MGMDPSLNIKFPNVSHILTQLAGSTFQSSVHKTKFHGVEFSIYGTPKVRILKHFGFQNWKLQVFV